MDNINVIHVCKNLSVNGISTVIKNYCKYIYKDKYNISIITGNPVEEYNLKFLKSYGINVFIVPNKRKKPLLYFNSLRKILTRERCDIIHIHGNSSTMIIELLIAFFCKIKIRIVHCHNTKCDYLLFHKMFKPLLNKLCTYGLAPSVEAEKWCFNNKSKHQVIINGIEKEKYIFSENGRLRIRKKLGIKRDDYLIGNVGTLTMQKNQQFLLKIFEKLGENPKNKLIIIGMGPEKDNIQNIINNHKYKERIILYDKTNNIQDFYSAMDIFLFPSLNEGLGLVAIEAQINGLKTIISENVPKSVIISNDIEIIQLENMGEWITQVNNYVNNRKKNKIDDNLLKKYDVKESVKQLESLYYNLYNNVGEKKYEK